MEQILLSIMERIHSEMPSIQTIDEDYGQLEALDNNDDTYPLVFPAVLIDTPQAEWSNLQGKSQKGTLTLRLRLLIDCYDDTHYGSNPASKIKERAELVRTLHKSLQGFHPATVPDAFPSGLTTVPDASPSGSVLIRTSSHFFTAAHGIKVYESTYTITLTDLIQETVTVASPQKVVLSVKKL